MSMGFMVRNVVVSGLCGLLLLTVATSVQAVNAVSVQGLFGDKAVLLIDGKRRIVRVGEESPEGIKLIAIHGEKVELAVNGKTHHYKLGETDAFSTNYAEPNETEVTIPRDNNGMYSTVGSINGFPVSFLVDTGASVVTLNAANARRLGIDYRTEGQPVVVNTASSVERAFRVTLDKVSVGDIEMYNVGAVIMTGPHPVNILLGLTFLGKVEIQRSANVMKLKK
jgi:aspartyl protease family protein